MDNKHDVVEDEQETPQGKFERITCRSEGCLSAACVRQPWMKDEEWQNVKGRFRLRHPQEAPVS